MESKAHDKITLTVNSIGSWAALLAAFFSVLFTLAQLLAGMQLMGVRTNLSWMFIPLIFSPAFLIVMIAFHYTASRFYKVYTAIGVAFAVLYCGSLTLGYAVQATAALPIRSAGSGESLHFDLRNFLHAVDFLSYFFIALSLLFAACAFKGNKWLYRSMRWNVWLLPLLLLSLFLPNLYFADTLWMVTFPIAMFNAAFFFRNRNATSGMM